MDKETILKKAIEKAVKNGYRPGVFFHCVRHTNTMEASSGRDIACCKSHYYPHIFDLEFAKAFWGEELLAGFKDKLYPEWQIGLQQMVLEEDPIKYLEKFL